MAPQAQGWAPLFKNIIEADCISIAGLFLDCGVSESYKEAVWLNRIETMGFLAILLRVDKADSWDFQDVYGI